MKKLLAMILALAMVFALCACGSSKTETASGSETLKFGLICLHDENSTYDANFINSANEAVANLKAEGIDVELVVKTGIPEGEECYEEACNMADAGCSVILADSFGHEDYIIKAAKEYPEVQFLHATGYQAQIVQLANFHDGFAAIYQGRYLAGVAAGLKLQEMIDNGEVADPENVKVGYVGAYTYAEVISGYTSWFLGVRSVVPQVTMEVTFTGSWYDETLEKEGANTLIENGCVLISQHADSMGAPTACETAGVPDVTYNVPTGEACPNTFVIYSKINWAPYIEYAVKATLNGEDIGYDYVGTFETGSVVVGEPSAVAAAGTAEKLAEVKAQLISGELHVFDCSTFTVGGETLTADDATYGQYIKDGYFAESELASAPAFAVQIDGIELLNQLF